MASLTARRLERLLVVAMTFGLVAAMMLVLTSFSTISGSSGEMDMHAPENENMGADMENSASNSIIRKLEEAEIIQDVIDSFTPRLEMSLIWPEFQADLGNEVSPAQLQAAPTVKFTEFAHGGGGKRSISARHGDEFEPQYIAVAMTDPDAPSRDDPRWSEFCHWIFTARMVYGDDDSRSLTETKELIPYKPPGPPAETGKHRYVFAALAASNSSSQPLELRVPADRTRWGYEMQRHGLRDWAGEMGLGVFGVNFFYAQNDVQ